MLSSVSAPPTIRVHKDECEDLPEAWWWTCSRGSRCGEGLEYSKDAARHAGDCHLWMFHKSPIDNK